jgi:hypothetical protein
MKENLNKAVLMCTHSTAFGCLANETYRQTFEHLAVTNILKTGDIHAVFHGIFYDVFLDL